MKTICSSQDIRGCQFHQHRQARHNSEGQSDSGCQPHRVHPWDSGCLRTFSTTSLFTFLLKTFRTLLNYLVYIVCKCCGFCFYLCCCWWFGVCSVWLLFVVLCFCKFDVLVLCCVVCLLCCVVCYFLGGCAVCGGGVSQVDEDNTPMSQKLLEGIGEEGEDLFDIKHKTQFPSQVLKTN